MKIAEKKPVLTDVEHVKALPEFDKLKVHQQKFILLITAGAKPLEAVRGAYNCKSKRSGERFLVDLWTRRSMQPILNKLYGQKDEKAAFLERIEALMRRGSHVTAAEVAALTLFGVAKGYLPSFPDAPPDLKSLTEDSQ
jgi:hypothetical protein